MNVQIWMIAYDDDVMDCRGSVGCSVRSSHHRLTTIRGARIGYPLALLLFSLFRAETSGRVGALRRPSHRIIKTNTSIHPLNIFDLPPPPSLPHHGQVSSRSPLAGLNVPVSCKGLACHAATGLAATSPSCPVGSFLFQKTKENTSLFRPLSHQSVRMSSESKHPERIERVTNGRGSLVRAGLW